MSIKIDTKKLEDNVFILKNDINEVNIILENISKAIDKIPLMWKSNKEEEVMENLRAATSNFSDINESNNKYLDFLDLIVKEDYESLNRNLDQLIDDKIAEN